MRRQRRSAVRGEAALRTQEQAIEGDRTERTEKAVSPTVVDDGRDGEPDRIEREVLKDEAPRKKTRLIRNTLRRMEKAEHLRPFGEPMPKEYLK